MHKKYDRGSSSYFLTLSLAVLDVKIDGLVLNDWTNPYYLVSSGIMVRNEKSIDVLSRWGLHIIPYQLYHIKLIIYQYGFQNQFCRPC